MVCYHQDMIRGTLGLTEMTLLETTNGWFWYYNPFKFNFFLSWNCNSKPIESEFKLRLILNFKMSNFNVLKWTSHTHSGLFWNKCKFEVKIVISKWKLESIELCSKSLVKFCNGFFHCIKATVSKFKMVGFLKSIFFALELRFLNFKRWIQNLPYLEISFFILK